MGLYEISWPDAPTLLISAETAGEALQFLSKEFGHDRLFQLEEFLEIKPDNFLLVRRCGAIYDEFIPPRLQFCPDSPARVFLAIHHEDHKRCVVVVEQLSELPGLLLWHYDYLDEDECHYQDAVLEAWDTFGEKFSLLEVDTQTKGILLVYDYCRCPVLEDASEFGVFEKLSKKDAN